MFGENQYDVFKHGANALVVGDYLTTGGASAEDDIKAVTALGYEIAFACHQ
jgi:biotin synthase